MSDERARLVEYTGNMCHLPKFMRDFHDQKDLFKTIHCASKTMNMSWSDAHCYTIDYFLKFMAWHGYTLQKSRAGLGFSNIKDSIRRHKDSELDAMARHMGLIKEDSSSQDQEHACRSPSGEPCDNVS